MDSTFTGITIFCCEIFNGGFNCELVVVQSISGNGGRVIRDILVVVLVITGGVKIRLRVGNSDREICGGIRVSWSKLIEKFSRLVRYIKLQGGYFNVCTCDIR